MRHVCVYFMIDLDGALSKYIVVHTIHSSHMIPCPIAIHYSIDTLGITYKIRAHQVVKNYYNKIFHSKEGRCNILRG